MKTLNIETQAGEVAFAAAKGSPPAAVAVATIAGMSLSDWVLAATLVYTVLQILLLVRKYLKERAAEGGQ